MKSLSETQLQSLRDHSYLTQEEYQQILKDHQIRKNRLVDSLLGIDLLEEKKIMEWFSEKAGIPVLPPHEEDLVINPLLIPSRLAYHYDCIPLSLNDDESVTVAFCNPFDLSHLDDLSVLLGRKVNPVLAGRKQLRRYMKKYYGIGADTVDQMLHSQQEHEDTSELFDESSSVELSDDASIIKFVNQVLLEAVKERATDIHIEPYENQLKIRYRIDGILYDAPFPTTINHFHSPILSRIKIIARLNISEKRLPQDGRFKFKLKENELDLRVSILPTPWGEAVNIRILSGGHQFIELSSLGLNSHELKLIQQAITRPHGIILVTGPTGSGKTTSLYAFLNRLNSSDRKIITIEDPIEYLIPNVTQLQVNPKINFTFSNALRSMLRHDPDVMMVGEIRDLETAEISIQVALTGHLVFSTLHTNDALSSISRMTDLGVEPFLVSSSVQCIIAQRLVRLLCEHCRTEEALPEKISREFPDVFKPGDSIYTAKGCERCHFTGYHGRTGIYEIVPVDDTLRELIQKNASLGEMKEYARKSSWVTLRENGFLKVKEGLTSIDEVIRVTIEN